MTAELNDFHQRLLDEVERWLSGEGTKSGKRTGAGAHFARRLLCLVARLRERIQELETAVKERDARYMADMAESGERFKRLAEREEARRIALHQRVQELEQELTRVLTTRAAAKPAEHDDSQGDDQGDASSSQGEIATEQKITLQLEYVTDGKTGKKYGPYWYGYWREGERVRKRYYGKHLPEAMRGHLTQEQRAELEAANATSAEG